MTTRILFLCPHNAAKSVAAAAFVTRQAKKQGIAIRTATAGTDPGPEILPIVRERLKTEGLPIDAPPSKVTNFDLAIADIIINIGCDHDALPTSKPILDWHIPDFSYNSQAALTALESHATALVGQLAAPTP